MNLESFHKWLLDANRRFGPVSVIQLMDEIGGLREAAGLAPYANLPTNGIECQELLVRLEQKGMAVRDGSRWRWAEGKPAVKEVQGALFG